MRDGIYTVEYIQNYKQLDDVTTIMNIKFEKFDTPVIMFGIYGEIVGFLKQEVQVTFRQDIFEGKFVPVINTLTVIGKVNVLNREEDIKLYINDLPDTGSNINFKDIEMNDIRLNAIVYCSRHEYSASAKAVWAELTILDKRRQAAKVKLFDPDKKTAQFQGSYVRMDLQRTRFGFNTKDVEPVTGINISPNPEIDLAQSFIQQVTKTDEALTSFLDKSGLMEAMKKYNVQEDAEKGYMIVRVAMEVAQAREYKNMSPIVDTELLIRGILANRAYCLTNSENNMTSTMMQNIINCSTYGGSIMNKKIMTMLESEPRIDLLEWNLYQQIKKSVDILIRARKNMEYTLSSDKAWR